MAARLALVGFFLEESGYMFVLQYTITGGYD
jgi:hypothetical protein